MPEPREQNKPKLAGQFGQPADNLILVLEYRGQVCQHARNGGLLLPSSGPVHHKAHANEGHYRPGDIGPVRAITIEPPAPG